MNNSQQGLTAIGIAENYARFLAPGVIAPWTADTLQHLQARPGDNVLDVGCGVGAATFDIARLVAPGGRVVGIDLDYGMLAVGERIRSGLDLRNVSLKLMDASSLDFPDEAFDRVVCQHALMYFADQTAALREMYRVLSRGGRLIVVAWGSRLALHHESLLAAAFRFHIAEEPLFFDTVFSLSERGRLESLMRAAGLKTQPVIERRERMTAFPNSESYWQGMVMGRSLAYSVEKLPERVQMAIKADVIARLRPYKTVAGNYEIPMEAIIATVTKP